MEIILTREDLEITGKQGNYSYRINGDIRAEGFKTKREARKHAAENLKMIIGSVIKKRV